MLVHTQVHGSNEAHLQLMAIKRSAGVTLEVNLRNLLQANKQVKSGVAIPKTGISVAPEKNDVLQKILKKDNPR